MAYISDGSGGMVDVAEAVPKLILLPQAPAVPEPPQAILRPEELDFSVALRGNPVHNGTAAVGAQAAQAPAHDRPAAGRPGRSRPGRT